MRSHHATAMALLAMAILPLHAGAQGRNKEPKRPELPATADTNDPRAYYLVGERLLAVQPDRAADAFYWATRLDPSSADFLYARRTALLMKDPRRLVRYLDGDRRTLRNSEVLAIDSLQIGAFMANPFLYRRFEKRMHDAYIKELFSGPMSTRFSQAEIDHAYDRYLQSAGPATAGWIAYADGRFDEALARYAQALSSTKRKAYLRTERGRIFQMTGNSDSALAMLHLAGEELRNKDNKEIVFVYDSKALLEYSIGKIHEAADRTAEAREAYGRALQEDMAFYPAHVALAALAVAAKDTVTMTSEMELAVQLRPKDPLIRLLYGYSLATLGQPEPAVTQLEEAIALEPLFARPYRVLAEVHDRAGDPQRAIARYEEFLSRSAKTAPDYADAATRLAQLRQAGGP